VSQPTPESVENAIEMVRIDARAGIAHCCEDAISDGPPCLAPPHAQLISIKASGAPTILPRRGFLFGANK
jgi:hypothetical protein